MLNSKLYLGDTLISKPSKGTISIAENGLVDVSDYASAEVFISNTVEENDVNFYDYDGRLVASYSKEDFANLSVMPNNPTNNGLTAQGWSWTLSDAKEFVAQYEHLDIGQYYITDDGKTRLYLNIRLDNFEINLFYSQTVANAVEIDWGDNSSSYTSPSVDTTISVSHTYTTRGQYVLKMSCTDGEYTLADTDGNAESKVLLNSAQQSCLTKVEVGANVARFGVKCFEDSSIESITIPNTAITFSKMCFRNAYRMKFIVIPSSSNLNNASIFEQAYSLEVVAFPNDTFSLGTYVFRNDYSLKSCMFTITSNNQVFYSNYALKYVKCNKSILNGAHFIACSSIKKVLGGIPEDSKSIGANCFAGCKSLQELVLPSSVNTIGASAFSNCYSLLEMTILSPSAPTLSNINAFTGCNIRDIYVPANATASYAESTNWQNLLSNTAGLTIISIPNSDNNDN